MAGRFSVESVFKAIDRVTAPVSRMRRGVARFTRSVQRGFRAANRSVNTFGRTLNKVARTGRVALLGLGLAAGLIVVTGANFEQQIVNAAAKFAEGVARGSEEFKALERVAQRVGATTEFTAIQAAQGLDALAKAGFNAKQAMTALPGLVDLATAAQTDFNEASDIATRTLGAFSLKVKDATQLGKNLARVNDVMALTATTSKASMQAMIETIRDGGPVAESTGASIETFLALTGKLADGAIEGSKAGTTLKNMFLRLVKPVGEAKLLIKNMKVDIEDGNGNFLDMFDILAQVEKGLAKMGTRQKAATILTIFGLRAVAGTNKILKIGSKELIRYRDQLRGAGGASKRMADMMRDTLRGSALMMVSAFEGLQITIHKLKDSALRDLVDEITRVIRIVDEAVGANKDLATQLVDGVMRAVKGTLGVFGILVATFIVLKALILGVTAATALYTVGLFAGKAALLSYRGALIGAKWAMIAFNIASAANPIGLLILVVVGAIAAIVLFIKNWDRVVGAIKRGATIIKRVLSTLIKPFTDVFGGVKAIIGIGRTLGLVGPSASGDEAPAAGGGTGVVSPQARTAKSIEEHRTTSSAELTIKDETGRAELSKKSGGFSGLGVEVIEAGGF